MHVALLRGINVGSAKRIAMADLRALVEGLGFRDVRTLLNSGNIIFSAPKNRRDDAAARIEKAMSAKAASTLGWPSFQEKKLRWQCVRTLSPTWRTIRHACS